MSQQSGNALWFILIAIGLLGLLTVSLTRSGSSTNDTGSFEQNQIVASEILSYAKSIENAVQSLLARGCSENELSFWHDSNGDGTEDASDDYYNDGSPTDRSCHIFDVAGAGMTNEPPKQKWLRSSDSAKTAYGRNTFATNNLPDLSANLNIMIMTPYIKENICTAVNRSININGTPEDDTGISISNNPYDGTFPAILSSNIIGDSGTSTILTDKKTGCVYESSGCGGSDCYSFYHVLHTR
jgi:hypothetical protein